MDLSSPYLGFNLKNPFVAGASPLADNLDSVRRLEDAGAAAIVMRSLFVEQIIHQQTGYSAYVESVEESYAEATTYFPEVEDFALGPDQYLAHIQKVKQAVDVPVIASINGSETGDWFQYARMMEEAGADALELNLYFLGADPEISGSAMEDRLIKVVAGIRDRTRIPVAVKLSPYYSSLAHFARSLDALRVNGLVLFNRFYQPDIDIENLEVTPTLKLSSSEELLLRLRWIAILYGKVDADLALSGGVHGAMDAVKGTMAGASCIQVVSALLREGPDTLKRYITELQHWLEEFEYESLEEMRGNMSHMRSGDAEAIERTNYMKIIQSWKTS